MDFSPPLAELLAPQNWNYVRNLTPDIIFDIYDSLAGLDPLSISVDFMGFRLDLKTFFSTQNTMAEVQELNCIHQVKVSD
jgi:hypothetical protein